MRVRAHPFHILRINKMLSCAGADRLQTGMRHAYGKPCGLVARVEIGQIIFSLRTKNNEKANALEALRRAKYKFPGRQHIVTSTKWGFTEFQQKAYQAYKAQGRLRDQGVHADLIRSRGQITDDSVLLF